MSRKQDEFGSHKQYTPFTAGVMEQSIEGLAKNFLSLHILVNDYEPHSARINALQYN